jgi:hypothetical protein
MMQPMRYPSFAASEGLKDEAVAALRDALRCGDLPYGFYPQLLATGHNPTRAATNAAP